MCLDRISHNKLDINLKIDSMIKLGFFRPREDISYLYAHFGVTWFPIGNIKLCKFHPLLKSLTQKHESEITIESRKGNYKWLNLKTEET